jgi:hypothetical protein
MTMSTGADSFYTHLLRLLLHVAWSDEEVDPVEARLLLGAARRWNIPEEEFQRIETCLAQGQPIPVPDMGLLRSRGPEVLRVVRALIESDKKVLPSELEMMGEIRSLLNLPETA